jgi:hypothetical protein
LRRLTVLFTAELATHAVYNDTSLLAVNTE